MQTKHILILAGWGASVCAMVAALPTWQDAATPAFVGGALGTLFTQVVGMYSESPTEARGKHDAD